MPRDVPAPLERTKPETVVFKAGLQSPDDPLLFVMSDETVDRMGDVIEAAGWQLVNFQRNPIALWEHRGSQPIGIWENVRVEGKRLVGRLKLAAAGTSAQIDELRALVEQRILRAVSVGFLPSAYEKILDKQNEWTGGFKFTKAELLECSLCSVPANPAAIQAAKSLGVSEDTISRFLTAGPNPTSARRSKSAATVRSELASRLAGSRDKSVASPPKPKPTNPGGQAMRIADRIEAAQKRLAAIKDETAALMKAVDDDGGRDFLPEEEAQLAELEAESKALEDNLVSLRRAETIMARNLQSRAVAAGGNAPTVPAQVKNEKPGDLLVKHAVVQFLSYVKQVSPITIAERAYANDQRVDAIVRTAVEPATTTNAGWAAELIETDSTAFLQSLEPVSVYAQLRSLGVALQFGRNGSILTPQRGGGREDLAGSWVGESNPIPVKRTTFGGKTMNRYKLGVISTFSRELANQSIPQIEGLIRQQIIDDTAYRLDMSLLDGAAAVAGLRPASIINGVPGSPSAGNDAESVIADLRAMMTTVANANAGRNLVLILNPTRLLGLTLLTAATGTFLFRDEIGQGRLLGVRIISSTNVPAGLVVLMDAADFATASGDPEFEVSSSATLVMLNDDGTDPTMNMAAGSVTVDGAAGVVDGPAPVRSLFQTDSIGIRMILPMSWQMMRTGVIGVTTGAAW